MKRSTLSRLFAFLRPNLPAYLTGISGEVGIEIGQQLLLAFMVRGLTDAAVTKDAALLLRVLGLSSVFTIVIILVLPLAVRKRAEATESTTVLLRETVFGHMNTLSQSYWDKTHSGDAISRLTNDVNAARDSFGQHFVQLLSTICVSIACTIYMFSVSYKLAIAAFALGVIPLVFNRKVSKPLREVSAHVQKSLAHLSSRLRDLLTGIPVIRTFGLEQLFSKEYAEAVDENLHLSMRRVRLQSLVSAGNDFFGGFTMIGMLILASYMIYSKELVPGAAVAAVQLTHNLLRPFHVLGDVWSSLQQSLAGADRLFAILDMPVESIAEMTGNNTVTENQAVSFSGVRFAYDNKEVLTEFSFSVPEGKVIAFAGPSGGGKSTVFKLLLGLCSAQSGVITMQGHKLSEYDIEELRRLTAYVPQDSYLYSGTILENIQYGKLGASEQEIIEAAKAANAHEFIMSLPDGYATAVGERGTQLSGGQRQRIAIARAILKNAPILLLDEATSSLDSEAEGLVQEALERLMRGRTTLLIAHRLSTIRHADCIYVLDKGQIVESGTHDQLLEYKGLYYKLHQLQVQEAKIA